MSTNPDIDCDHKNATIGETLPSIYLDCPDCNREVSLGLKGISRADIDALLLRFAEHIRQFEKVDNNFVATPRAVLVHGVLEDCKTHLPVILASFQMAIVKK